MFDKFKQLGQLNDMRKKAAELQKELEKIIETFERRGWTVSVTGDQKVRYIKDKDGNDYNDLVEAINEAMKRVQKESAKKMMEMGGGLGGLLGGMGK